MGESVFTFLFKYPPRVFQRGELVLAPVVPVLVLSIALAAVLLIAFFAARSLKVKRPADRVVIGILRSLVFLLVAGCLLRPALALSSAVPQRNALAVLLDDSRSMQIKDVGDERRVAAVQRVFSDSTALVRKLGDRFALRFFRFSADAAPLSSVGALNASGTRTDIAAALESARQELADVPVAGMVVVSDGADNGSGDLSAALLALRTRHVPVYTVGVGRERFDRDVSIERLDLPTTTLVGAGVLATASIAVRGVAGDSTTITVEADGRIVASQPVRLVDKRELIEDSASRAAAPGRHACDLGQGGAPPQRGHHREQRSPGIAPCPLGT